MLQLCWTGNGHSQLQMWLDGPNIGNYTFLKVNNNDGYKIPKSNISPLNKQKSFVIL